MNEPGRGVPPRAGREGSHAKSERGWLEDVLSRAQVSGSWRLSDVMEWQPTHRAWVTERKEAPPQSKRPLT